MRAFTIADPDGFGLQFATPQLKGFDEAVTLYQVRDPAQRVLDG